jgi:hypothetical protein
MFRLYPPPPNMNTTYYQKADHISGNKIIQTGSIEVPIDREYPLE